MEPRSGEACDCGRCDACARRVLQRAAAQLSAVYETDVDLRLEGRRVVRTPRLAPRPPPRPPAPAEGAVHARARAALAAADDPLAALELRQQHDAEDIEALTAELRDLAVARGHRVDLGRHRLRISVTTGSLIVRVKALDYTIGSVTRVVSGPDALRAAIAAELALDGALVRAQPTTFFVGRLLAGEQPRLDARETGFVRRFGLLEPDAPAAWLRAEIAGYLAHGPRASGLGSPVATTGVVYGGGRLLAIDGIPLRHTDAAALAEWRLWACERARRRQHPVVGHRLSLSWQPTTWGPPGRPGARLPFARDGPEEAQAIFDRHRRMYARVALPPSEKGRRPPTDWGRAKTPMPLEPPTRSRGRARALYAPIVRHWLVGWSLAELADGARISRSAVDRLVRSARATSQAAREAFERNKSCTYAGRWLAVNDGQVVVTDRWEGRHG